MNLEDIARQAIDGDREALNSLVTALPDDIFGLALRMLWNREDAEDATQERPSHRAGTGQRYFLRARLAF